MTCILKCPTCDRDQTEGAVSCPACGARLGTAAGGSGSQPHSAEEVQSPEAAWVAELEQLVASGLMLNAVKRYRDMTGASLVEAKNAVEQLRDHSLRTVRPAVAPEDHDESHQQAVLDLLRQNKPIAAIRLYRQHYGADLKSSKEAVEELARQHGVDVQLGGWRPILVLLAALLVLAGGAVVVLGCLPG